MNLLRRLFICLAFAMWCFAGTWVEYAVSRRAYFTRYDPVRAVVLPTAGIVIPLTFGMLLAWEFCRRKHLTKRIELHFLFLAVALVPAGAAAIALWRAAPAIPLPTGTRWIWLIAGLAGAAPLIWMLKRPRQASRFVRSALLYSWPVLLLILLGAVRGSLLFAHGAYHDGPFAPPLPASPDRPRVVWIIFDELSQTIAFGHRAPGLSLPNLDRLKAQSFYATSAESPANRTLVAMPSLILGQRVQDAMPDGPDELRLKLGPAKWWVAWSSLPNVFDSARGSGFNTAVVGWYHPYGRVLRRSLTECYWVDLWRDPAITSLSGGDDLLDRMRERAALQLLTLPLANRLPGAPRANLVLREKSEMIGALNRHALDVVTDPKIGLALIHLPVPHPPAIYDPASGDYPQTGRSYADDVALADRELGMLRSAMENAGLWDGTAILVSADHGWRTSFWRGNGNWTQADESASQQDTSEVPFLMKLPQQKAGTIYREPFNTIVTRSLITAILNGQLTDPASVPEHLTAADPK